MNLRAIELSSKIPGCDHFRWKEVLFLPQWGIYVFPHDDQVISNLISVCRKMEMIRKILGKKSIRVTSAYRPKGYNKLIGGAEFSAHVEGLAIDFQHSIMDAEEVRTVLRPRLGELNIRMENIRGNWVHIDMNTHKSKVRYFKP